MTQLCRGHQIKVSSTCLGLWQVVIGDEPRFDPVRMFWILGIDFCTFDFCLFCDLRVAELFLIFSLRAGRSFRRIPSVTQSLAKIVEGLMLVGSESRT
jgi:hypothetical protein